MSYENAVPKPLKFLISDGKMIDDAGNVIAESETLKDLYTKWNPEAKKYLLSDGSVVDENNNLIIKNDYYKKMYDQATPKVAKYLHADGTVDENPGGGSGAAEDGFYKWHFTQTGHGEGDLYCSFDKSPENMEDLESKKSLYYLNGEITAMSFPKDIYWDNFVRVSDTEFTYTFEGSPETATRVIS